MQVEMGQGRVRGPRGGKEFGLGKKKRRRIIGNERKDGKRRGRGEAAISANEARVRAPKGSLPLSPAKSRRGLPPRGAARSGLRFKDVSSATMG